VDGVDFVAAIFLLKVSLGGKAPVHEHSGSKGFSSSRPGN
jgi:hypothetical protein